MASTELLASKVVILEEEPQIPAIAALPSAVLLLEGVCERGPLNDPQLTVAFSEWAKVFGGFTLDADAAIAAHGFYTQGGVFVWTNRICHYTDLTNLASYTAVKGSVTLSNSGSLATAGAVTSTGAQPFNLRFEPDLTLDISTDGGGPTTATIVANAASVANVGAETWNFGAGGQDLTVRVDGGAVQTVTFLAGDFVAPAAATAEEVAARLNASLVGATATATGTGTLVTITSDRLGSSASVQVTGGTANVILAFPTTLATPSAGSNVSNLAAVTGAEIEAIVELAVADLAVTVNSGGTLTFATETAGATHWVRVESTSGLDTALGFDNTQHTGANATPAPTLTFTGKTPGAYTADITVKVEAAPSGVAAEFVLKVLKGGVVREVFPNIIVDSALTNYVVTVVNHPTFGSDLVQVTDLALGGGSAVARPANGTSAAMTGGNDGLVALASSDFIGNSAGPTGFYAFDRVTTGRILVTAGTNAAAVYLAMLEYAASWRNGSMFCVFSVPEAQTHQQAVTFVSTNGLLEHSYGEFGAIYWPWIKVVNPQPSVFGDDTTITVDPAAWVAGVYARNDQKVGGVYESPAGIGGGWGIINGLVGVEDDPSGGTQHPVLDERARDLVYPNRINPITQLPNTSWHIDGCKTLRSTGNFPFIGERRGVIFIEQSLKSGLVILKHRFNNRESRQRAARIVRQFLIQEMNKGAFRSRVPDEAFFVDVSDAINPLASQFAGIMNIRIGLATNKPTEFIVILVTQDTRGLAAAA